MLIDVRVTGNADQDLSKVKWSAKEADKASDDLTQTVTKLNSKLSALSRTNQRHADELKRVAGLNVKLQNDFNGLTRSIKRNNDSTRRNKSELASLVSQYLAVSTAAAGFKKVITDFSDLEQKTIEIAKTTGLAGVELENFTNTLDETSQSVRGMKLDSLYEISAVAGQLGIKGKDDLLKFTLEIQKIAKTSTLTATQAGEGFAQLSNSLNEPIKNINKLTSTFTALASTTTANEAVLLDYSQRLAGAGKTLGLTSAQIVGIGATLKDVGITSEVGGTAISQVFQKILTDGDKMAKRIGIDMKYFAKVTEEEPVKAVQVLLEAIGRLDKKAKTKALKDLQLSGSGLSSTLLKLSSNTNKLRKNILTANQAYARGTDATKEFDIATKGLATTYEQFNDKVKLTSASIGAEFAPAVDSALRSATSLLSIIERNKHVFVATTQAIITLRIAWKAMNLVMRASPFGLVAIGLAGVVTLAYQASKAIANVFETEQRRARLAQEYTTKIHSKQYKDKKTLGDYDKIISKEKELTQAIELQSKELQKTNNYTAKQKGIIQANIAKLGQQLNATKMQRVETERANRELLKMRDTTVSIKVNPIKIPKIEIPPIPDSVFVEPILRKTKEEKKAIREIAEARKKAQLEKQKEEDKARREEIKAEKDKERDRQKLIKANIKKRKQSEKKRIREELQLEKERFAEIERLEADRQKKLVEFGDEYRRATLAPIEYNFEELNKQRKEWLDIGADAMQVQTWYIAQAKEITKEEIARSSRLVNEQQDQLDMEQKKTAELARQNDKIGQFMDILGDSLTSSLKEIVGIYAKTGDALQSVVSYTQSGALSQSLASSDNPYAVGVGITAQVLSQALSSEINLQLDTGIDNTSIERSLLVIEQFQNPQQDFLRSIADNTHEMKLSFGNIAKGLAGNNFSSGSSFNETIGVNSSVTSAIDFATLGLLGDDLSNAISGLVYNVSTSLKDSGIRLNEVTASELKNLEVRSFQLIKQTETYLGLVSSSKDKLILGDVNEQASRQIGEALQLGIDSILESATKIGIEGTQRLIDSYVIDIGDIDLKGLEEAEIATKIEALLGNQLEGIAQASTATSIEAFRRSGDDYYSTLIRVSGQFTDATATLESKNIEAITAIKDITNTTGDIYAETIRESLERAQTTLLTTFWMGNIFDGTTWIETSTRTLTGIGDIIHGFEGTGSELLSLYDSLLISQDRLRQIQNNNNVEVTQDLVKVFGTAQELQNSQATFYSAFVSDAEKLQDLKFSLERELGSIPDTKEQYLALVRAVDLQSAAGRERYALLLREQGLFTQMIGLQTDIESQAQRTEDAVVRAREKATANRIAEESRLARVAENALKEKIAKEAEAIREKKRKEVEQARRVERERVEKERNQATRDREVKATADRVARENQSRRDREKAEADRNQSARNQAEQRERDQRINDATRRREESIRDAKAVRDAWKKAYESTRSSIGDTILKLGNIGKEKNTENSLVQDLVDYNQLKKELRHELSKEFADNSRISSLNSSLSRSALNLGNNDLFTAQKTLQYDLESIRRSLPNEEVQKVTIVNDDNTEILNRMVQVLGNSVDTENKSRKILLSMLEELEDYNKTKINEKKVAP